MCMSLVLYTVGFAGIVLHAWEHGNNYVFNMIC